MVFLRRASHYASIVALFLLLTACAVDVRSQQPPRPPDSGTQSGQAQSTDEIANELRSIALELRASREQNRQAEADRAKREAEDIDWSNWYTQVPLVVIALFSVFAARRAFYLTHRPHIVIRNIAVDGFDKGTIGDKFYNTRLWVLNDGLTPATVLKLHAQWLFEAILPLENPVINVIAPDSGSRQLRPGEIVEMRPEDFPISFEVHRSIWNTADGVFDADSKSLYLVGYVKYRDAIGNMRRTFFCRLFEPNENRFVPVDNTDYESAD